MFSMFFVFMSFPTLTDTAFSLSRSTSEMSKLENTILNTSIDISSFATLSGSKNIDVVVDNVGTTKIWEFDKFDVVVTYDADTSSGLERVTEKLQYITSCPDPPEGYWCVETINPDTYDQGILNPDESITIDGTLGYPVHLLSESEIVVVSTENGESDTRVN